MKIRLLIASVLLSCVNLGGCVSSNVVEGYVVGTGIGYVLGDSKLGGQIGATAGLLDDIWN